MWFIFAGVSRKLSKFNSVNISYSLRDVFTTAAMCIFMFVP